MFCCARHRLSRKDKLRRSYYELLRDELDQFILGYALVDSYKNFSREKVDYPFVEIRELKPRARIPSVEFELQNSFLVLFSEAVVDQIHKKYIRYFDVNKTTKTNLMEYLDFQEEESYHRNLKFMDTKGFFDFMKSLLTVDYALLIQRELRSGTLDRYALTHFHVRIDWPIADAAEDLARDLRYISKDLYEKGDKYAENLQKKFFEYYGMPVLAGGRRTAAIVAAQYFRKIQGITTVYVGSSESRALLRIDEQGISKSILMRFTREEVAEISKSAGISQASFTRNYVVAKEGRLAVCIFNVVYAYTPHALPSEGGRMRELKFDINWLTVSEEQILPKPNVWKHAPISVKIIYSGQQQS